MRKGYLNCFIALVLILSPRLFAQQTCSKLFKNSTEYLFGLEFTFTNPTLINEGRRNLKDAGIKNNPLKENAWKRWVELLEAKCHLSRKCFTHMSQDKHGDALRVEFEDGYYFTVGIDASVLEVNAHPKSAGDFSKYKDILQEYVFGTAKKIGLHPHQSIGQGHVHISMKAFGESALLFRNFFIDFQNRPEIVFGALGNDLRNSPPLSAQKPEQRSGLYKVLRVIDRALSSVSIKGFVSMINTYVYNDSVASDWGHPQYYQAFNMTRWNTEQATLEIRSFRPQESAEIYELQISLLEAWIEKLRDEKRPIEYLGKSRSDFTPQEIVGSFYKLITDLELPWETYKVLLPEKYRHLKPDLKQSFMPYKLGEI